MTATGDHLSVRPAIPDRGALLRPRHAPRPATSARPGPIVSPGTAKPFFGFQIHELPTLRDGLTKRLATPIFT